MPEHVIIYSVPRSMHFVLSHLHAAWEKENPLGSWTSTTDLIRASELELKLEIAATGLLSLSLQLMLLVACGLVPSLSFRRRLLAVAISAVERVHLRDPDDLAPPVKARVAIPSSSRYLSLDLHRARCVWCVESDWLDGAGTSLTSLSCSHPQLACSCSKVMALCIP